VERFNRNLKAALTIYHHSQHVRWDENLPHLAMAFNTAWHESTGSTPALLFLGREMNHPLALRWELSKLDLQLPPQGTQEFWERARDRVARRYNVNRRQVPFQVGDLVLVKRYPISSKLMRCSAKLENKWSDPLVIARFLTQVMVQLANPDTGVIVRKAHVSQLKRYFAAD
jgi:hypothetical protein